MSKGQVTVFVLLGIFIVILAGVFIYFRGELLVQQARQERFGVSEQFKPVRDYYEGCLRQVVIEGLQVVGSQGGYLELPEDEAAEDIASGFSRNLDVFGNGVVGVPYWSYQQNNKIERAEFPSLKNVEKNVEDYVGEQIGRCFENSSVLSGDLVVSYGSLKPQIEIQDEKVFVEMESPVNVQLRDVTETIQGLQLTLEVPYGKMYKVAREIFEEEQQGLFLEERTLDMMALYDEIPVSDANFDCGVKVWRIGQVKADFKKILQFNLPLFAARDKGGGDAYRELPLDARGLDVLFTYHDDWPFFMEVGPEHDGFLKSDNIIRDAGVMKIMSKLFCLQNYQFVYDVKYPVLVQVRRDDFVFQYAVQVVIEDNVARKSLAAGVEEPSFDVCENANGQLRVGIFRIADDQRLVPTDAVLRMKCLNQVCELGGSLQGEFAGDVPACVNALITAEKVGYYHPGEIVSTNEASSTSLILEPVEQKRLDVKLIRDGGVEAAEDVYVLLELRSSSGHEQSLVYPDDKGVELIADNYHVKAYVFARSSEGFAVGGEIVENCVRVPRPGVLGIFSSTEECYQQEIPEQKIQDVLIGGGEFEFEVARDDLLQARALTVYLIAEDVPRTNEEMAEISEKLPYYHLDSSFREPELK